MFCEKCGKELSASEYFASDRKTCSTICLDCFNALPPGVQQRYSVKTLEDAQPSPEETDDFSGPVRRDEDDSLPGVTVWMSIAKIAAILSLIGSTVLGGILGKSMDVYGLFDGKPVVPGIVIGLLVGLVLCTGLMLFADMAQDIRSIRNHLDDDK